MIFRIIPMETHCAALNMAYDEACMRSVREEKSQPTVRLYRWKPSAVSIGNFQCLADEIDIQAVKEDGISVVRRQTGGGAVYHDMEGEVTYSLIAPEHLFSSDIIASYKEISNPIIQALKEIGIHAEFRGINDITVNKKKISGNAQTRKGGVILQHGTILFSVNPHVMFRYLTPDKSKISDKPFIKSVNSSVTCISDHTLIPRSEIEAAIRKKFIQQFDAKPAGWTIEEQEYAQELVLTKYSDEAWNAMR